MHDKKCVISAMGQNSCYIMVDYYQMMSVTEKIPLGQIHKKKQKMYKNEIKKCLFFCFSETGSNILILLITTQKNISSAFMWYVVYASSIFLR